jgi:hypothetical protein
MISALAPRLTALPAAPATPSTVRPEGEWWEVGGKRFDSTADLVSKYQAPGQGVDATYHFGANAALSPSEGRWTRAGATLVGAAIGGAVVGGGAAVLGAAGEILNALMLGAFSGGGGLSLLGIAAVGAIGGGVIGFVSSKDAVEDSGVAVSGTLMAQSQADGSTKPVFLPGGQVQETVDLADYAKAAEVKSQEAPPVAPWKDVLKGAAVGAAAPLSIAIPLVGIFAPTYLAVKGFSAADSNSARGAVIGGVLGVGATAAGIAAINGFGLAGAAVVAGAGALTGAIIGPRALPRLRQEVLDVEARQGQWWSKYEQAGAR